MQVSSAAIFSLERSFVIRQEMDTEIMKWCNIVAFPVLSRAKKKKPKPVWYQEKPNGAGYQYHDDQVSVTEWEKVGNHFSVEVY